MKLEYAYYLERDLEDGRYKEISQIIDTESYVIGELFITSKDTTPPPNIKIKVIIGEQLVYDELIRGKTYGLYTEYKLHFSQSGLPETEDYIFRAYKLNQQESDLPHIWILFEEIDTARMLDELEEKYTYNLLGETTLPVDG